MCTWPSATKTAMRFGAPRSSSPSPVRISASSAQTSRSCFRAPSDDSSDEYDDLSDSDASLDYDISVDSSSVSSDLVSKDRRNEEVDQELLLLPWGNLRLGSRKRQEEDRVIAETVASIRSHSRHVDSYREWESQTRKNAFHTARKQQFDALHQIREMQRKKHKEDQLRLDAMRFKEIERIMTTAEKHKNSLKEMENRLREKWKERHKAIRDRIERVIKEEEDKLRMAQEADRRAREEAERKKKAEEDNRLAEEAKKKAAEEERLRAEDEKRKRELELRVKQEKEALAKREQEERAAAAKTQEEGDQSYKNTVGLISSEEAWKHGLRVLRRLKTVTMRAVKGPKAPDPEPPGYVAPVPPPLKKLWSAQRRKITPKIGQLTDDPDQIKRITEEIKAIIAPIPNMSKPDEAEHLHHALLSSFAKVVIMQAETEVTAHKEQATPLARVAISLISTYDPLGDIFWAKLCERAGCWITGVPATPLEDEPLVTLPDKVKMRRWGARSDEGLEERVMRIAGVFRLYIAMLLTSVGAQPQKPLPPLFRPARYWVFLAQVMNDSKMLARTFIPELVYVSLNEGGMLASRLWGKQFIKMLEVIYELLEGDMMGGDEVVAQASRARVKLEIEKILAQI